MVVRDPEFFDCIGDHEVGATTTVEEEAIIITLPEDLRGLSMIFVTMPKITSKVIKYD